MLDSLRGRLLFWYTAAAGAVIAIFGAMVCYLAWRTRVVDVDTALHARATALVNALRPAPGGTYDLVIPPLPIDVDRAALPYHAIWAPNGTVIDMSSFDAEIVKPRDSGASTRGGHREVALVSSTGPTVLVGRSLEPIYTEISGLAGTVALLGAMSLLLSFAGGWWIVGHGLQPIDRIGRTARSMVEGHFDARIPIDRVESELGELARALNEAFDRLHGSLERQQRFSADASHELRTPLATISTETQWSLARERSLDEYRHSLDVCRRAAVRMEGVVERLLALARARHAADAYRHVPVPLGPLVQSVLQDLRPLADAKALSVSTECSDLVDVVVDGDPDRLFDAVTNVVANAIHYNVPGGRVSVTIRDCLGGGEITVADTGIGIAPSDLPRVFEPFFRADPARSREAGGAGLGLALTRAIVEAHGGRVTCSSQPDHGTAVRLWLASSSGALPAHSGHTDVNPMP
ncbi:MAG: ATP-binding protein [Vicinamibacterales bacterium]